MKRKLTARGLFVASACVLIVAAVAWGVKTLHQRRSLPYELVGEPVVAMRLYSVPDANEPPESAARIHDWKIIGDPVRVPPAVAAEVRDILRSPSSYTIQDSDCFEPGMAISFGDGAARVDVLICLLCNKAIFYRRDSFQGRHISTGGNQRFSAVYSELFKAAPSRP